MAEAGIAAKPEPALADAWTRVQHLPCLLTVEIPIPTFRVADLVRLTPGRVFATSLTVGQDVPLRINGELIAWSELEAIRDRLAVRLTELA